MEQVRGAFSAHMLSCSADPQAPLSSVDPGTMADMCWLNHLWTTAHEGGDDSWSSQQHSITAAHTAAAAGCRVWLGTDLGRLSVGIRALLM